MKKVLIILYYFPPSGGPGVQRWLKFCKYLPEFGIEPIIFKPKNPSYPILDYSLLEEVSNDLSIVEFPIWEPYKIAEKLNPINKKFKAGQFDVSKNQSLLSKISIFIRGNFFIPDARKFWIKPSSKFLNDFIKKEDIKTIITSGPPHSLHLIGLNLKKQNPDLKWFVDFRDPWTEISYHKELKLLRLARNKHKKLEQNVIQNADCIIATSFTDAKKFIDLGAKKSETLTNGFDNEPELNNKINHEKFKICYAGVLEQLRNPSVLWIIISELITENQDFKQNLELIFVGRIDDKIMNQLYDLSLKNHIYNKGYLSYKDSYLEMQKSNLLLICNFPSELSQGIIPGKLFEYLSTSNKIISIGPEKSDVEIILEQTQKGKHFSYIQKTELKNYILNEFNSWKQKKSNTFNKEEIIKYHRKNITKKLAELIKTNF